MFTAWVVNIFGQSNQGAIHQSITSSASFLVELEMESKLYHKRFLSSLAQLLLYQKSFFFRKRTLIGLILRKEKLLYFARRCASKWIINSFHYSVKKKNGEPKKAEASCQFATSFPGCANEQKNSQESRSNSAAVAPNTQTKADWTFASLTCAT